MSEQFLNGTSAHEGPFRVILAKRNLCVGLGNK